MHVAENVNMSFLELLIAVLLLLWLKLKKIVLVDLVLGFLGGFLGQALVRVLSVLSVSLQAFQSVAMGMGVGGRKLTLRPGNELYSTGLVSEEDGFICLFGTVMCLPFRACCLMAHRAYYREGHSITGILCDNWDLLSILGGRFLFNVFELGLR